MSVENVQKFFELVKSNEDLAQEIEKIKNEAQNKAGTVDYEKIISENVIPMAKERGLEFTLEDFLTYSSSIAPQGELSDDDLLNVSGGWSGNQMLATGLMLLTLGSSGLSMMGNIQSPGGGDGSSAGSAPTSSYSMSINNTDEATEETAEDTILQKVENSNIEKSSEDVSNEADEVIENNSEESDVADEDNGSTEDVSFNEEDAATTAQEYATEATEEETEIETNDEAIDFSSRLGYEDLDADNKELKNVSIDWKEKDNAALEDFFAEDDEENDGIEMTEEEINIDLNEGEDVYNYEAFYVENNEETTNEGEENDDIKEFDNFNNETQILNFDDVDEDENTDEAINEADVALGDLFDDTFWNAGETNIENKEENTQNNEEVKTEVDLGIESAEAQEEVSNKERKKDYKPISIAEAEGASDKIMTVEQKINHVYKFLEGLEVTNENQNKIEAQFENSGDVKGDIADLLVSTPSDVGADAINKLDEMGSLSGEKQLSYENYDRNASWEAAANHVGKALEDAGGRQGIKPSTWAGFEKDLKEVNSRIRTDKKTGNLYLDESKAGGWFGESKNTNISQERLQTIKTAADNLAKLSKK